jgi:peptide/nickel transport system permease protein
MILILATFVFLIVRVLPGDPVLLHFGKEVTPQAAAAVRHSLGLDKPIYIQYAEFISGIFQGNLGKSFSNYQPISSEIMSAFPATLELAIYSIIVAIVIGIVLGVRSSRKYGSAEDAAVRTYGVVSYAIPVFFLGLVLQAVFAIGLHILPATGRADAGDIPHGATIFGIHIQTGLYTVDSLLAGNLHQFLDAGSHLILPSIALGVVLSGVFVRITRSNMLETLDQDYVTTARARGLKQQTVLYGYAFRNAFLPVLTVMGLQFAALLAGAILTETTFAWGGLGTYLFLSIEARDYTAIEGTVVFLGILVALVSLIVDILYAYLDPRIKY